MAKVERKKSAAGVAKVIQNQSIRAFFQEMLCHSKSFYFLCVNIFMSTRKNLRYFLG